MLNYADRRQVLLSTYINNKVVGRFFCIVAMEWFELVCMGKMLVLCVCVCVYSSIVCISVFMN